MSGRQPTLFLGDGTPSGLTTAVVTSSGQAHCL